MSFKLYQLCALVFLGQGLALPIIALISGRAWWRQASELEALSKQAAVPARASGKEREEDLPRLLAHLPKLAPLQCQSCGAGLRLGEHEAVCSHCSTRRALPEDYAALARLKPLCVRLIARANRHVRLANALQHTVTRTFFRAMIFVEPILLGVVLFGAKAFPESAVDRALEAAGEGLSMVVMMMAFLGFIIWMVVFVMLSGLAGDVREHLAALPVLRPTTRARETAQCAPCGAPIAYESGALAALCDYCHVVSYRARFAGQERAASQAQVEEADATLFGAMRIIEEHTSTFFFTLSIMMFASLVLCVICVLGGDG